MPPPHLAGSRVVRQYLEEEVERDTGGRFLFTDDVEHATRAIVEVLDRKRVALKLAPMMYGEGAVPGAVAPRTFETYDAPKGVVALGCGKAQERSQSRPPTE